MLMGKLINYRIFGAVNVNWTVGGHGKWIQVDNLKYNPKGK